VVIKLIEVNNIKKEVKEYFEYIKEVYLILFDKILNEETKIKIKNINFDVIELEEETEFKIKINGNIKIGLNLDLFILNNKLENNKFSDIDEEGIKKIEYYIENKNNILKVIKDNLLESMLLLFIGDNKVLQLGTVGLISKFMSKKYNLGTKEEYIKEGEVISHFVELFGECTFYRAILNSKLNELEETYNKYVDTTLEEDKFKNVINELNKIYDVYGKNKDKVFLADSVYYYQNIDYSHIVEKIDKVKENKESNLDIAYERINSVDDCVRELDRYKFLYSNDEAVNLYYASLEIKKILSKINEFGNVDKYYNAVLEIEQELRPLVNKIWEYYLNFPDDYSNKDQHWFLVENLDKGYKKEEKDFIITNLITNDNIKLPTNDSRYQYGFIYRIKPEAIIYTSLEKIVYRECGISNCDVVQNDNNSLEIEEQKYSILMSPRNLMVKTIDSNSKCNNILTNTKYINKTGVFCVTENEEDLCYQKALDLANMFDLPLIPMVLNEK